MPERKTVNDLEELDPARVFDVRDRHGCLVNWTGIGWRLFGKIPEGDDGPFTYDVLPAGVRLATTEKSTPDAALMERIVQAEKEDVYEDIRTRVTRLEENAKADATFFDGHISKLNARVDELADKVALRLTELEGVVETLSDRGDSTDGYAKTGKQSTQFVLTEVPEGINIVWDTDDGQAIHRLADGGWMFGLMSGGFPGEATGEIVDLPEVYRVATTPSED